MEAVAMAQKESHESSVTGRGGVLPSPDLLFREASWGSSLEDGEDDGGPAPAPLFPVLVPALLPVLVPLAVPVPVPVPVSAPVSATVFGLSVVLDLCCGGKGLWAEADPKRRRRSSLRATTATAQKRP